MNLLISKISPYLPFSGNFIVLQTNPNLQHTLFNTFGSIPQTTTQAQETQNIVADTQVGGSRKPRGRGKKKGAIAIAENDEEPPVW